LTCEYEESIEPDTESEFDLESEDFNLDQIIKSAVDWASSPNVPIPKSEHQILSSNESTPSLELKVLPEHLKCAYLGGKETLPIIIASHLAREKLDVCSEETQRGNWMDNEQHQGNKSSDSAVQDTFV